MNPTYATRKRRTVPDVIVGIDAEAKVITLGEVTPEQLEHWGRHRVRVLSREQLAGMWRPGDYGPQRPSR